MLGSGLLYFLVSLATKPLGEEKLGRMFPKVNKAKGKD
jgi:hypothetical protein